MNDTSSGVAFDAAKMMSPSFSRSSSSTTTTALPAAMSAIAASTSSNRMPAYCSPVPSSPWMCPWVRSVMCLHHLLDVLRDHVHLEVDALAGLLEAQGRPGQGLG